MMEPDKLREAMESVAKAHAVLADFHREVAAFFAITDELLADNEGRVRLEPEPSYDRYVVLSSESNMTQPVEWSPTWLGRFYRNAAAYEDKADADANPATMERLALAFIWIASRPLPSELPGGTVPECVFGVAHPGEDARAKSLWDAAYNGLWKTFPTEKLALDDWRDGEFAEMSGKYGRNGSWSARRIQLVELPSRDAISEKLTGPLLGKFVEKFGSML